MPGPGAADRNDTSNVQIARRGKIFTDSGTCQVIGAGTDINGPVRPRVIVGRDDGFTQRDQSVSPAIGHQCCDVGRCSVHGITGRINGDFRCGNCDRVVFDFPELKCSKTYGCLAVDQADSHSRVACDRIIRRHNVDRVRTSGSNVRGNNKLFTGIVEIKILIPVDPPGHVFSRIRSDGDRKCVGGARRDRRSLSRVVAVAARVGARCVVDSSKGHIADMLERIIGTVGG